MNYAEAIAYLYSRLPLFSRLGSAAYKKDLTNIIALCEHLGNPHTRFRSVHVGGTNGKGSVSHMLAATFTRAGYKTGLYTSPHLYDFRERIKVDGQMVPEDFVVRFTENIQPLIEKLSPSFFEITVAMAFRYFAEEGVDIAIVEVGLGGRLDSTNIITPELSVITNIGWDHMNMLGNTLPEIAGEKAGIIKEGVPAVIGERSPETENIFKETARAKRAPLFFAQDRFVVNDYGLKREALQLEVKDVGADRTYDLSLDLPGTYQLKNVCTVLQAVEVLKSKGWNLPEPVVKEALAAAKKHTGLYGRWEVLQKNPTVVLEVAHNINGMTQMLQHVNELDYRQLHLVMGMVKDKDASAVLSLLPKNASYYFTQAAIPRALDATELKDLGAVHGLKGKAFSNVNEALAAARAEAALEDLIIVCGSIFLVAEVNKPSQ